MTKFRDSAIDMSWVITMSLVVASWSLSHVIAMVHSVEEAECASCLSILASWEAVRGSTWQMPVNRSVFSLRLRSRALKIHRVTDHQIL